LTHSFAEVDLVVWTSTVWSLPANQAVAYGADMDYCIAESETGNELLLVAQDLLPSLVEKLRIRPQPLATFKGILFINRKARPKILHFQEAIYRELNMKPCLERRWKKRTKLTQK